MRRRKIAATSDRKLASEYNAANQNLGRKSYLSEVTAGALRIVVGR